MKLSYLEYFLDVVKFGSITKAAEAHYLKQGNLSRYIKYIEDDFNATLFVRSSKGVELTPEGEQVYLWAKETLDTYFTTVTINQFLYINKSVQMASITRKLYDTILQ